jgi:hypothetical protein
MSYNSAEQILQARVRQLCADVRFWKRACAMLATLLLACAIVIALAYSKLP